MRIKEETFKVYLLLNKFVWNVVKPEDIRPISPAVEEEPENEPYVDTSHREHVRRFFSDHSGWEVVGGNPEGNPRKGQKYTGYF